MGLGVVTISSIAKRVENIENAFHNLFAGHRDDEFISFRDLKQTLKLEEVIE